MAKIPEHTRRQKAFKPEPKTPDSPVEGITSPIFKQRLLSRYFVRLHMTVMLGGMILAGVGVSKLLLEIGVRSMPLRYAIAVSVSYATFFLFLRIWLWYIGVGKIRGPRQDQPSRSGPSRSGPSRSGSDIDFGSADVASSSSGRAEAHWSGFEGGRSGGAGASDSWGSAILSGKSSSSSSSSSRGFSAPDIDLGGDDGCGFILVLALLALLLFGIFGMGIYLIYQSPAILAEAAFQAALASGLIKATIRIESGAWVGGVFQATVIPFAVVLALAVAFGVATQHYSPTATKVADIFHGSR